AAIHVSPEALDGGPISKLRDGDIVRVDANSGSLDILTEGVLERPAAQADLQDNRAGIGRELFDVFRANVGRADEGATPL
ncbi:MAG: dihydroxy-acid dehydratase, partial [Pseudomonadota bacterium]